MEYDLVLSASQLEKWFHSERCYFWRYLMHLVPNTSNQFLVWGTGVDIAMNVLYAGGTFEEAVQAAYDEVGDDLDKLVSEGSWRSPERLKLLVEEYITHGPLTSDMERYEVVSTQFDKTVPVMDEPSVGWRGLFDLVLKDKDTGLITVIDNKTTTKDVNSGYYIENFRNSTQVIAYDWMSRQEWGDQYGGFAINAIRSSPRIEYAQNRFPILVQDWEAETLMRDVRQVAPTIVECKANAFKLIEDGHTMDISEELQKMYPFRRTYGEKFCDYQDLNFTHPDFIEGTIDILYRSTKRG